jgi:septum formation protein
VKKAIPILASASSIRARLLADAGVDVEVKSAPVDESEIKASFRADGASAGECAVALAELKASRVSARHPQRLVIGADQILVLGDEWFDKPADRQAASRHLQRLRGVSHTLVTAVAVARGGTPIWRHETKAHLTMRRFSDAFLENYLTLASDEILGAVGAYQVEGLGLQFFEKIDGDFFSILGLPLLPLLGFLREHGVVQT